MKHQTILVERFLRTYPLPAWLQRLTLQKVLAAPVRQFLPDHDPTRNHQSYDLGRLHALWLDLQAGKPLDPIIVECEWSLYTPSHFILEDGHHRLKAVVLAGHPTIAADCGGPVDGIRWLQGRRKNPPQWLIDGGLSP